MTNEKFMKLCHKAIEHANSLLGERGDEYNQGGIKIEDYFGGINNPEYSAFDLVWIKTLRTKSRILSGLKGRKARKKKLGEIADAINYYRFLYAIIKSGIVSN